VSIERVGVIGAGQMGSGIAEVSAKAGAEVVVFEPSEELVTAGRDRITGSLERATSRGKLSEGDRDATLARLKFTTSLADLSDRQLVIEAVVEDETVKAKIFARLDELIADPDAVLASNTSSIPIMKIAAATQNPSRVLGLHFFNPVPVLPLVELISTLVTSDEAASRVEQFASNKLGKQVVRCGDRSGFIVNALLVPYLLSAIRMAEAGVATVDDIDKAAAVGPHRAGHDEADRGLDVRRVQGRELRPAATASAHGRGGPAGQEVRPGLLHVLISAGKVPRSPEAYTSCPPPSDNGAIGVRAAMLETSCR
jgi:3-hydroxybutyryl-CoA dehydrogenase